MKFYQNKKWVICIGVIIIAGILSVVLLNNNHSQAVKLNSTDQKIADMYAMMYQVPLDKVVQLKSQQPSWKEVNEKLMTEKYLFGSQKKVELYDNGYSIQDIEKAESLALKSGINANEIIQARGKGKEIMSWSQVKEKLNLIGGNDNG